jgi:hypothetical protein
LSIAGYQNLFAGVAAGQNNTGPSNSFFGNGAGYSNVGGAGNSFFGRGSGILNNAGAFNSFFGANAGGGNTTGGNNVFVGLSSGSSNTTESNNTYFGALTTGTPGVTNATAIGWRGSVTQSNSLVLGSINGVNGATASTNIGIGTTAPQFKLHVVGENVRVENSASYPRFSLNYSAAGVDQKRWQNYASPSSLQFTALNDAENFETPWLQVFRGTGTAISLVKFPSGNVGIGNILPSEKLTVDGTIQSLSGGFKFVDGTVQTIAAGTTYTTLRQERLEIAPNGSPRTSIAELNLPPGKYQITATFEFWYGSEDPGRAIECYIQSSGEHWNSTLTPLANRGGYVTVHTLITVTSGITNMTCGAMSGPTDRSYVETYHRRLTATRLENVIVQ